MPSDQPSVRRVPDQGFPNEPVIAKRPVRIMRWAASVVQDGMLPLGEAVHQFLSRGVKPSVEDLVEIRDVWRGDRAVKWRSRAVKVSAGAGVSGALYFFIHHFAVR
jgi:hypothetical protein